jgi:hypothetical protein
MASVRETPDLTGWPIVDTNFTLFLSHFAGKARAMRLPIGTNCWLCIVSSIALVVSVPSSPMQTPQTSDSLVNGSFPSRSFTLIADGSGLILTSATPKRESVDAHRSVFNEAEDESSWSFSHLASFTYLPPDSLTKLLSDTCPGNSPPRTAAVPLRC